MKSKLKYQPILIKNLYENQRIKEEKILLKKTLIVISLA